MICSSCNTDTGQIVYCDCFAVLCRECFAGHHCGHEHLARFTRADDDVQQPGVTHQAAELSDALFRLRPYQRAALDAVLEVLT